MSGKPLKIENSKFTNLLPASISFCYMVSDNKQTDPTRYNPALGSQQEFRWLRIIVASIIFLNIFDAIFTLFWVNAGLAQEANVLMRYLVHNHPVIFVSVKFTIVFAGTYVLWKYRFNRYAVLGLFVIFLIYYALLLHHLRFSSHIVFKYILGP
jgi:hypothetical protein